MAKSKKRKKKTAKKSKRAAPARKKKGMKKAAKKTAKKTVKKAAKKKVAKKRAAPKPAPAPAPAPRRHQPRLRPRCRDCSEPRTTVVDGLSVTRRPPAKRAAVRMFEKKACSSGATTSGSNAGSSRTEKAAQPLRHGARRRLAEPASAPVDPRGFDAGDFRRTDHRRRRQAGASEIGYRHVRRPGRWRVPWRKSRPACTALAIQRMTTRNIQGNAYESAARAPIASPVSRE